MGTFTDDITDGITYIGKKLSEEYDTAVNHTGGALYKGAKAIGISDDTLVTNPVLKVAAQVGDVIQNAVHKVLPAPALSH